MKAITLWQPWASLIAAGLKTIETRPWRTSYRGPLIIHASARLPGPIDLPDRNTLAIFAATLGLDGLQDLRALPRGACLAVVDVLDCIPTYRIDHGQHLPSLERAAGNFGPNRYAWKLERVQRLRRPIPARGRQRLWNPGPRLLAEIQEALS